MRRLRFGDLFLLIRVEIYSRISKSAILNLLFAVTL